MKKTILFTLVLSVSTLLGQTKKAALIGLGTRKTTVTYYGKMPQVMNYDDRCQFDNSKNYSDSIGTTLLKNKVDSIIKLMNFMLIAEDSVIMTTNYNELARKIRQPMKYETQPTYELPARGYSYTDKTGFGGLNYLKDYFSMNPRPDIIIDASIYFELNIETKNNKDLINVVCNLYIKSFTEKNKKPFKFRVTYKNPHPVAVKAANTCSGYEITEDISKYKIEAIYGAFSLLDKDLPKEIEDVNKFYSK